MLAKQMRDLLEQDVTEEYMLIDGKPPRSCQPGAQARAGVIAGAAGSSRQHSHPN
jgi:hypothetical protein